MIIRKIFHNLPFHGMFLNFHSLQNIRNFLIILVKKNYSTLDKMGKICTRKLLVLVLIEKKNIKMNVLKDNIFSIKNCEFVKRTFNKIVR